MKLDKQLIPIPAVVFLIVIYIISQSVEMAFTYYNLKEHSRFSQSELPITEKNNLSTSLNARVGRLLYQAIISQDQKVLADLKKAKQELKLNIEQANNLMLKSRLQSFRWIDRSDFERIENRIVYLIESKKFNEALEELNGAEYATATSNFFLQLESVGNQLRKNQQEQMQISLGIIWINTLLSILFVISTLFVGYAIFQTYKRNLKSLAESEENLETQRVINIRNAKMAELGEMAGSISHEINNPLSIIQGNILRIKRVVKQEPIDTEKILSSVESAQNTIKRITNIISSLQKFSRDSTNDSYEEVSIKEVITETIGFCIFRLNKHSIQINTEKVQDFKIRCKSVEISQVILNLLNNSIDAVSDLPVRWIEVSTHATERSLSISVKDSGGGINEEFQGKIFQNYFTTKDKEQGTGIGLNISKALVERHDGQLLYDKTSQNTKFDIVLPLKRG